VNGTGAVPVNGAAAGLTHDTPAAGPAGPAADMAQAASGTSIPRWLQTAGGWSWRLLFIAIALYLAYRVAGKLAVVLIPCAGALLLTALLQPLTARLHRAGLPMLAAAWCALLGAVVILAGVLTLVTIRVRAEYPGLVTQVRHTTHQIQTWMAGPPLHLKTGSLQSLSDKLLKYLGQHKSVVAGTVLTGGQIVFEVLGGVVLALFVTFFLLKDGQRIWAWLLRAAQPGNRPRVDRAARAAWQAVVYYVRGTVLVAAVHSVVIGLSLTIMGVPLVVALAVLVFVAAFIPLVGILFAGAVVILITLATKGWFAALILLIIFVAENQIESHLLQPLVVGRFVRLHPLGIILALAVGGVVAGIPGAVVAVPIAAAITRAAPELRRPRPLAPPGSGGQGGDSDSAPGPR
jgi:predicted PurR-regulated permease PerM